MAKVESVPDGTCRLCCKSLTSHSEIRPARHTFTCWYCEEMYCDKVFIEMHIKIHHGRTLYRDATLVWYTCKLCSKLYMHNKFIRRHMRSVHGLHASTNGEEYTISSLAEITFRCKDCFKPCLFSNVCPDHRTTTHTISSTEDCSDHIDSGDNQCHVCQVCYSPFASCSALWTHMFGFHKKDTAQFTCNLCSKETCNIRFPSDIVVHMRRKHDKLLSIEKVSTTHKVQTNKARVYIDGVLKHWCSHCYETFDHSKDIKRHFAEAHAHIRDRNAERTYTCNVCGERFQLKKRLRAHYRDVHNKMLEYECAECPRAFSFKSQLTRHMISHTRERASVCELCGAAFSQPAGLYNHKFTHESTRYPCTMCDKSYTHPSLLKVHLKTHTETTRFMCEICGKDFNSTRNLKRHKLTHNTVKCFVCSVCNTGFTVKKYLIQHYKTHRKV